MYFELVLFNHLFYYLHNFLVSLFGGGGSDSSPAPTAAPQIAPNPDASGASPAPPAGGTN